MVVIAEFHCTVSHCQEKIESIDFDWQVKCKNKLLIQIKGSHAVFIFIHLWKKRGGEEGGRFAVEKLLLFSIRIETKLMPAFFLFFFCFIEVFMPNTGLAYQPVYDWSQGHRLGLRFNLEISGESFLKTFGNSILLINLAWLCLNFTKI